jgi:hypothetical protein
MMIFQIKEITPFWDVAPCSSVDVDRRFRGTYSPHHGHYDVAPLKRRLISSAGHLGGVVVSVLATGPKGCGLKTRPRRWIFKGDKNPQHTFLSDGK